MSISPTVSELSTQLEALVDWELFAIHLPGIKCHHIEKIKRDERTIDGQKLALYRIWLDVCPNRPSWRDVVEALEKAKEGALAERIRIMLARQMSATVVTLEEDEEAIVTTLKKLHLSFTSILVAVRNEIKEMITSNKKTLQDCIFLIKAALVHIPISGLQTCTTIDEIFEVIIRECTSFMDGSVLQGVIELVIGQSELLQDITEHIEKMNQFKSSKPIKALQDKLHTVQGLCVIGKSQTKVIIKISHCWGVFYVALVETLIKQSLKLKGEIHWLAVESGCIQIVIAIPMDIETEIIDNCSQQLQLIELMGVIMIQIGSHPAVVNIPAENNADYTFERAILEASSVGNIEAVELLLEMDIDADDIDEQGQTPLIIASENGHENIVKHLLTTTRVNFNKQDNAGQTPLMIACENGHNKVAELLLEKGADPNTKDNNGITAIYSSCFNGHYTVTKTLIRHSTNPNVSDNDGWTPLMGASYEGHHKIVKLLLVQIDPDAKNEWTALVQASKNGHNEVVEPLLKRNGEEINTQDINGITAIYSACLNGHYTVTETLLKRNANPNVSDNDGWTPLMVASCEGHHEVVELLINTIGNNLMTRNVLNGITALMLASMTGHQKTTELLLVKGHDPNVQSMDGSTAIKYACINNHYSVVECLLKYKADPMILDHAGCTPLMYARQKDHTKIVELLTQQPWSQPKYCQL